MAEQRNKVKKRIIYKLMVLALKLARVLAVKYGCAAAILADAEGDSGYYKVRRPMRDFQPPRPTIADVVPVKPVLADWATN